MPFALSLSQTAREDVGNLVSTLSVGRRAEAIGAIERCCLEFATKPRYYPARYEGPPTFRLTFSAGGTTYYWVAAYQFSEDETTIIVIHVFRVGM